MNAVAERNATPMPIVEIDGGPYVEAEWLQHKIYREEVRAKRWRQEARRTAKNPQLHTAYLWHALQATYRAEKWRRNLKLTLTAIEAQQVIARTEFGELMKARRIAIGMTQREIGLLAGVDHKTIHNIEVAKFPPSIRIVESIRSVPQLNLSWDDVQPFLKESTPAEKRNRRRKEKLPRRRKSRRTPKTKKD